MNREQLLSRLVDSGLSRSELAEKSDAYLEARLAARGEPHRDAGPARTPTRRVDAPMDPELAALMKHFDGAQDVLEAYHRADPWLNGEDAALAAATQHVRGDSSSSSHRSDASRTYDAGNDQELASLMRNFDGASKRLEAYHQADPWMNGEDAATAAAARYVADDATLNEPPGDTHAERIRGASARVGVNQVLSTEEYWAMSDEQRAAADKILADAAAQVAALRGGT